MTVTTCFVIEDAAPADAEGLGAILGGWAASTDWMPDLHSAEEDRDFVQRLIGSDRVRVARDASGAPLGFVALRHCDIAAFCVAEAARGQGIGKALLDDAKAREARLALWTFQANLGAIAFYRREGFQEMERTDGACNAERLPDVRMIWRRSP